MPGYGVLAADAGSGLIPWAEAERRLTVSHDYWVSTVRPDGRPHVMPVWGVWLDDRVWFSSARLSRKARNLEADPRCTLTTDGAGDPVVVDGMAERVTDEGRIVGSSMRSTPSTTRIWRSTSSIRRSTARYAVRPVTVIALTHGDFTGSPTRWPLPAP